MRKQAAKVTMSPAKVAAYAIAGMMKGKNEMIPGFLNCLSVTLTRFLPKWIPEKIAAELYKR